MTDQRRARTHTEMQWAASLAPCPQCGARPGKLDLYGKDDQWVLVGSCPSCNTPRQFDFYTEGDPLAGRFERLHLGDERPSQVIRSRQFLAELDRLTPLLSAEPRTLAPSEWQASDAAAQRAFTAIVELVKFLPAGAGAIPDASLDAEDRTDRANHSERYARAWLEAERDRIAGLVERFTADAPRIWAIESNGNLHVSDEIRGLFNQVTKTRVPTAADLRDYLATRSLQIQVAGPNLDHPAWSSTVSGADDLFVDIGGRDVTGIHLWDDSRGLGSYAELAIQRATLADVEDATGKLVPMPRRSPRHETVFARATIEGHALPVYVDHDNGAVKLVTVHFDRPA